MRKHSSVPERSVRIETTAHAAHSRLEVHSSSIHYLSIVLAGSYVEQVGSHSLDCLPMRLRFHEAHEEHSHRVGPVGARCLNIELSDAWSESLNRLKNANRRPILVESGGWWALQAAALHRDGNQDAQLLFESLAAELLILCERQSRIDQAVERSAAIKRAIISIEDGLGNKLSLTELALAAGLHPTHFARSFRKTTGLTVGEYIRHRRVARAQALMISMPSMGISRIAAETGFADHAHLTRTFRQISGAIPSGYRSALEREGLIS